MIELTDVVKEFDGVRVVDLIELKIKQGEFLTFLGPRDSGKTTILRLMAGFDYPTSGRIVIEGRDSTHDLPHHRNVHMIGSGPSLFPHMTVAENVAFGLRLRKQTTSEIEPKVNDVLKLLHLNEFAGRMPKQLTRSQQQQAAIARALVLHPAALLLDEPLGSLDIKVRKQMQMELKHLQMKLGIAFIYATRDPEESLIMSDRIAVIIQGRLVQIGRAAEIYDRPATSHVAGLIGETNLIQGRIEFIGRNEATLRRGDFLVAVHRVQGLEHGCDAFLSVRPERVWFSTGVSHKSFRGVLKEKIDIGSTVKLIVETPGIETMIISTQDRESASLVSPGDTLNFGWDAQDGHLLLG